MNPRVTALIDGLSVRSPLQTMFRRQARNKLAVLAYHSIDDPRRFAGHLDVLVQSACPVSFDDIVAAFDGAPLPDRAVLVTFDDADATIAEVAAPLLAERGIPALAFVVTSTLDSDRPLWPAEARDLLRAGGHTPQLAGLDPETAVRTLKRLPDEQRLANLEALRRTAGRVARPARNLRSVDLATLSAVNIEIGNHTMTHPCLNRCTTPQIQNEIAEADRALRIAGVQPRAFAYPNGDTDERVAAAVQANGYSAAFMFDHHMNSWPVRDRLEISRLRVNGRDSVDRFRAVLSGLHPAFLAIRPRALSSAGRSR